MGVQPSIANITVPGIYTRVVDLSAYAMLLSTTNLALLGTATYGPVGERTRITDKTSATRTFGSRTPDSQLMYAIQQYLEDGTNLMVTRVTDGTDTAASADVIAENTSAFIQGTESGPFNFNPSLPAVVTGTEEGDFVIDNSNNKLLFILNSDKQQEVTLPSGIFTAPELAARLNSLTTGISVVSRNNKIVMTTNEVGVNASIVFLEIENNAYDLLGFKTSALWNNGDFDSIEGYFIDGLEFSLLSSDEPSLVADFLTSYVTSQVIDYNGWTDKFREITRTEFKDLLNQMVTEGSDLASVRAYLTSQSTFKFLNDILAKHNATVDGFYNSGSVGFSSIDVVEMNINNWLKNDKLENPLDWWKALTDVGINKTQFLNYIASSNSYGDFTSKLSQNSTWLDVIDWMAVKNVTSTQIMQIANSQEGFNDEKLIVLLNWKKWATNTLGSDALFAEIEKAIPGEIDEFLTVVDYITVEAWKSYLESLPSWATVAPILEAHHVTLDQLWSNVNTSLSDIDQKLYLLDSLFGGTDWKPDFVASRAEFAQTLLDYKTVESWSGFWRSNNELQKVLGAFASAPFTLSEFFLARTGHLDEVDLTVIGLTEYLKATVKEVVVKKEVLADLEGFDPSSTTLDIPSGTVLRFAGGNPQNATLAINESTKTAVYGMADKKVLTHDVKYPATLVGGSVVTPTTPWPTDWSTMTNCGFSYNGTDYTGIDFSSLASESSITLKDNVFPILETYLASQSDLPFAVTCEDNNLKLTSTSDGEGVALEYFAAPSDTSVTDISTMFALTSTTAASKKDGYTDVMTIPHRVFGWAKNANTPTFFGVIDINQSGTATLVEGVLLDDKMDYAFQTDVNITDGIWESTNISSDASSPVTYDKPIQTVTLVDETVDPTDEERAEAANEIWNQITTKLDQEQRQVAQTIVENRLFSNYEMVLKNDNALVRSREILIDQLSLENIWAAKGTSYYEGNVGKLKAEVSNARIYQNISVKDNDNIGITVSSFGDIGGLYITILNAVSQEELWRSPIFGTPNRWTRTSFQYLNKGNQDISIAIVLPIQDSTWMLDDLIVTNLRDQAGTAGEDRFQISVDQKSMQEIILPSGKQIPVADVVESINSQLTGAVAVQTSDRRISLQAISKGPDSSLMIDAQSSPAAPILGFGYDAVNGADSEVIGKIEAFYTGTEGNKFVVELRAGTDSGFKMLISQASVVLESFDNLSLDVGNERYWASAVTKSGISANGSSYVKVTSYKGLLNTSPVYGQLKLSGGTDGISGVKAKDYIGVTHPKATGMQLYSNPRVADINLLAIPGISDMNVILAAIQLCEERQDCFYIADCPDNLSPDQVTDWANGQGGWDHAALNSNVFAVYYPWGIQYDPDNDMDVHVAPSGAVAGIYARTANIAEVWFPPAGYKRGLIHNWKSLVYPDITHSDMVILSGNQNIVNTILDDSTDGIVVMTQKTGQRSNTALNRVGTELLILNTRKLVATAAKYCIQEPNDETLWNELLGLLTPIFVKIKSNRGFNEYLLQCDETTNTDELRNNNITRVICSVIPEKSGEAILIDLAIHKYGDDLGVTSSTISY